MSAPQPLPDEPALPQSFWLVSFTLIGLPQIAMVVVVTFSTKGREVWLWPEYAGIVLLGAVLCGIWYQKDKRSLQEQIAHHLVCPRCRYLLDNPDAEPFEVCPECGTDADPQRVREIWARWSARHAP